jgi:hypothetical protein
MAPTPETYWHATRLEPGRFDSSVRYATRPGRHSLYWHTVFSRAAYDQALEVARARPALSMVDPAEIDPLAHELASARYHMRCLRELVFEGVRAACYPTRPSRRDCLFLLKVAPDGASAVRDMGWDDGTRSVLGIVAADSATVFTAELGLLNTTAIMTDIEAAAHAYWQGAAPTAPATEVEVLLSGEFYIRQVISTARARSLLLDGRTFAELHSEWNQTRTDD